jgi:hypothetical protein
MKLYTEEQVRKAIDRGYSSAMCEDSTITKTADDFLQSLTPIELPSDEEIVWNTKNPIHIDNYIVHRGAEGVSLGWWNGEEWIEMWSSKKLNVYGWIIIPNTPIEWMKEQILCKEDKTFKQKSKWTKL